MSMAAGAPADSSGLVLRVRTDIGTSIADACALAVGPSQWTDGSLLVGALAVGAVGGAFALDNDVRNFVLAHTSAEGNRYLLPWQDYGNGLYAGCGAGALYCSGLALSNDWLAETGRSALTALALTGIATTVLKVAVGRARPYTNEGPHRFSFFQFADSLWSFPSGHAATAFTLSAVLAARIDNGYVAIPLYGIAAMTAVARVYGNQHWTSDVVTGALIGTAIGHCIGSRHPVTKRAWRRRVEVVPVSAGTQAVGVGICVNY
jgi:hypothetical protein